MKVLVTGANGQLGRALRACAPAEARIVARGRDTLDCTDAAAVAALVEAEAPDLILNAAAYTAVDKAESEEDAAYAANATAVANLAATGVRLVHVSTDFVFDGLSGVPYPPDAPTSPVSVYGRTKLAGERAAGADALIVRTAWVYASTGGNFVRTMLGLMASRPQVRVVADQIGTPTHAPGLAAALWTLARQGATGLHHYTDSGTASRYDFAVAIQEEALAAGLIGHAVPVVPIATADVPTPARRPYYAVLDKTATVAALGGPAPHWRAQLRTMLGGIKADG